jgi:hypothetical protein
MVEESLIAGEPGQAPYSVACRESALSVSSKTVRAEPVTTFATGSALALGQALSCF